MPTHRPLISDLPHTHKITFACTYTIYNALSIIIQVCNLVLETRKIIIAHIREVTKRRSHTHTYTFRLRSCVISVTLESLNIRILFEHTYHRTHTMVIGSHQVCLSTTSLSHSPWICSWAQGFSIRNRSQSIRLYLCQIASLQADC